MLQLQGTAVDVLNQNWNNMRGVLPEPSQVWTLGDSILSQSRITATTQPASHAMLAQGPRPHMRTLIKHHPAIGTHEWHTRPHREET
jgi:hypothetical protein